MKKVDGNQNTPHVFPLRSCCICLVSAPFFFLFRHSCVCIRNQITLSCMTKELKAICEELKKEIRSELRKIHAVNEKGSEERYERLTQI